MYDRWYKGVVAFAATVAATVILTGCSSNGTPSCNVDNKSIDCDASFTTSSAVPSSSVKPTTSVSRTPSTTTTTSTTVPTTTSSTTSAAPDTISIVPFENGYVVVHSDGRPQETYTYPPTTSLPAPVLAPTKVQPQAAQPSTPAPSVTVERRALIPQDNVGSVVDAAGTPVYSDQDPTYIPPAGYGNPRLRSVGANGFSELMFTATPTVSWSYIVVQNESQPDFSGSRFNLSSTNINIGNGTGVIAYDFSGFDSIKAIYFVS